ncbi:hypothetical protein ACOACQ_12125 [Nocardioides sp. CPCC 206347]|uniref:hypothetical protein n=1 Tax=unclassified Nocardioides TaxID=2615069 RepID=UPI00361CEB72
MTTTHLDTAWGALSQPVHVDAAGPADPTWKDNAYLSFWDVERRTFGSFHVSTSPNALAGRRARCSLQLPDGRLVEIVEDLDPGTFASRSISFGLDGVVTVAHPDLTARFVNVPLHTAADYSATDLIPALVAGQPLQHFQQGCAVSGSFESSGQQWLVDGFGMRDRTWGFRDETAQWIEYAGLVGVFDGVFITAMKFLSADGSLKADGFLIDATGSHRITAIALRRTAAAQFLRATLTLVDGSSRVVALVDRVAGFFVPMGAETDGPAFGAHDDFMLLELDGSAGGGFLEQGILHRVC